MNVQGEKRTEQLIRIRLTPSEKSILNEEYKRAFHATFSDFIRHKLLSKKISQAHQKKFEAYIKIGNLRGELNAIGTNVNQIAKRMNTLDEVFINKTDRQILMVLIKQLEVIRKTLDEQ